MICLQVDLLKKQKKNMTKVKSVVIYVVIYVVRKLHLAVSVASVKKTGLRAKAQFRGLRRFLQDRVDHWDGWLRGAAPNIKLLTLSGHPEIVKSSWSFYSTAKIDAVLLFFEIPEDSKFNYFSVVSDITSISKW